MLVTDLHTNRPLRRARPAFGRGLVALSVVAAMLISLAPLAAAQDDNSGPDFGAIGGWDWMSPGTKTGFTLLTEFAGSSANFQGAPTGNEDFDLWVGNVTLVGEVRVPFTDNRLSIFGDITYRAIASTQAQSTGWSDAALGAKFQLIQTSVIVFSVFADFLLPIGTRQVDIRDWKAINVHGGLTIAPLKWFAFNAVVSLGQIFNLENPDGNRTDSLEARLTMEAVFLAPVLDIVGRVGLTARYRDSAIDKDTYNFYGEVKVFFAFLRVGFPIDVDEGLSAVQQGYETGEIFIMIGFTTA